jgi:hypothetical protein
MTRRNPTISHADHEDHTEEYTTTVAPDHLSPFHTQDSQVPMAERGEELTLLETGYQKTFTFSRTNTFIQLDKESVSNFQLRLVYLYNSVLKCVLYSNKLNKKNCQTCQ